MSKKFNITTLSNLARINLSAEEKSSLTGDLEKILDYVDKLDELDTSDIEPTSHVLNIENVYREDRVVNQRTADEVLKVLPGERKEGRFFQVPKVIEDAE